MGSIRKPCHLSNMTTMNTNANSSSTESALCDILRIRRCPITNSLPTLLSKKTGSHSLRHSKDSPSWRKKSTWKSCGSREETDEQCSNINNNNNNNDNSVLNITISPVSMNTVHNKNTLMTLSLESITEEDFEGSNFASLPSHTSCLSTRSPSSLSSLSCDLSFALCDDSSPSPTPSTENPMEISEVSNDAFYQGTQSSLRHEGNSCNGNCSDSFASCTSPVPSLSSRASPNHRQNSRNNTNSSRGNAVIRSGCLVLLSHVDNSSHQPVFRHRSGSPYENFSSSKMFAKNSYNQNVSNSVPSRNAMSRCPVMVKIHQKSKYEKYAVVTSTRRHQTTSPFFLRLKNARVSCSPENPCHVVVVLNGADAKCYKFEASSPQLAKEWAEAFLNESPVSAFTLPSSRRKLVDCSTDDSDQLLVISEKNEFRLSSPSTLDHNLSDPERSCSIKSSLIPSSFQNIAQGDKSIYIIPRSPTLPVLSETLEEAEDDST